MEKIRAKFRCQTVEQASDKPTEMLRYTSSGQEPTGVMTWPRTYRFWPVYDPSVPEDQRYAQATPSGELRIQVDNPAVVFETGRDYYLDFTPAEG